MISIIVATDDDLLIGKKDSSNGMPWHNKEDLHILKKQHFIKHFNGKNNIHGNRKTTSS